MTRPTGIVVALRDPEQTQVLGQALYEAGYEALTVSSPEDVLRTTVGSDPALVVLGADMPVVGGFELHRRLQVTGLEIPPIVVVVPDDSERPAEEPPQGVYVIDAERPETIVHAVRLVLLSDAVQGEFAASLDVVHGDLSRTSFAALIDALRQHVVTGHVRFAGSQTSGLAVEDGVIIDAWRGPVRGVKAFNRLAGIPSGGFALTSGEVDAERTIEEDPASLVVEAVDDRAAFREELARLPSLDARIRVNLTAGFFSQSFTEVERMVLVQAQEAENLGDLIDRVPAPDALVTTAIATLRDREVISLFVPAGRVHVVTDSTADLLAPDARRLGIEVAAVSIQFGPQVCKDGIDISPEEFHTRLNGDGPSPQTHPVTRGEMLELYRRLIPTGDVLAVMCSAELSGSYENAVAAVADGLDELVELRRSAGATSTPRVEVVDSRQCSGPLGLTAIIAHRMLDRGVRLDEVVRRLQELGRRWRSLLMVPSLEFLHRNRGVGDQVDAAMRRPDVRWLVAVQGGRLEVIDTVDRHVAREAVVERLMGGIEPAKPVMAAVVHAAAPAEAAWMRTLLRSRLELAELSESPIGPAVTCNVGPGTVGVAVLQPSSEELDLFGP